MKRARATSLQRGKVRLSSGEGALGPHVCKEIQITRMTVDSTTVAVVAVAAAVAVTVAAAAGAVAVAVAALE